MTTAIQLTNSQPVARTYSLPQEAELQKKTLLDAAALVGAVRTPDENAKAVGVQAQLKALVGLVEKARKKAKEPILEDGRALDECCRKFVAELDAEALRISTEIGNFQQEELAKQRREQQRIAEEQHKIEEARQSELRRIAEEQAAAQAEARRKAEEEAKAARNAQEAAAAEARRVAAEKAAAEAAERAKEFAAAEAAQRAEAIKPAAVAPVRAQGQTVRTEPEITRINDWVLAKARPDLVRRLEFDMLAIKECLKRGDKLPGVEWREKIISGVRGNTAQPAIDV